LEGLLKTASDDLDEQIVKVIRAVEIKVYNVLRYGGAVLRFKAKLSKTKITLFVPSPTPVSI
jgi:hypothetical protein